MNAVEAAIYSRLAGTAGLTALLATPPAGHTASIFLDEAPQGASYPYVIFGLQGGGDDNKSPHRAQSLLYMAKALATANMKAAGNIDTQIDGALHLNTLTVTGWTNFWLARESEIEFPENIGGGKRVFHRGGVYRIRIAK